MWLRRLALAGVLLGFSVVVLGAYVRLTAAGLGCPDWPGCYGHFSPLGAEQSLAAEVTLPGTPLDVGKAWREMIHRYAASTLGFIIVLIAALAIVSREESPGRARYALLLLATVVVQGALGMLTVTWQLRPLIVSLHLLFGLTTLSLLWWLYLDARTPVRAAAALPRGPAVPWVRALATFALIVLIVQIALGGWTSSNYAAIACPDFPTCQGSLWPAMDYRDGFVLWHRVAGSYEGGVLALAARTAIHFTHRLGALVTTVVLGSAAASVLASARRLPRAAVSAAAAVFAALALQLGIGISMVVRGFPLALATAHNAGAALTLLAVLALLHTLRPSAAGLLRGEPA